MNFLAGGMILLSRQFTIGDFIKVNDTIGKVTEIQTRATILKGLDGTKIIVPNADLFTNQVISFTSNPFRRIEVVVGVEYDTNLQVATKTIDATLKSTKGILFEPSPAILLSSPAILLSEFAESSINIVVRFWVESHSAWLQTKSNVIQNIKKAFDEVGIGIPFPICTIYNANERDAEAFQSTQESKYKTRYPETSTPPVKLEGGQAQSAPSAPMVSASTQNLEPQTVQAQPLSATVEQKPIISTVNQPQQAAIENAQPQQSTTIEAAPPQSVAIQQNATMPEIQSQSQSQPEAQPQSQPLQAQQTQASPQADKL